MRVLVTGNQGYIGAIMAQHLVAAQYDTTGLDVSYYRDCDFGPAPMIPTIERDVRDIVPDDLEGFDAVVHLAALSNDPLGELAPGLTREINGDATIRAALAAREAGVRRFVFACSCSMYGAADIDSPLDEEAELRPLTAYAESKVRAEEELLSLAGPDFVPVSMRNATVYGVSPRLRLDIVLNNLAAWSHTTNRIRLLSDGLSWRPLIHVQDVAAATLALLEAPEDRVRGQAFNIGSDEQNYLIRDLAEMLSEITGCEVEIAEGSTADQRSYRVSFAKLWSTIPDLSFGWDAERGARELVEAYRTIGLERGDLEGDRYIRLNRLRRLRDEDRVDGELRWQLTGIA